MPNTIILPNDIKSEGSEITYNIDFENHFTAYENSLIPTIERIIKQKKIDSLEEKTELSIFILLQIVRNNDFYSNNFLSNKKEQIHKLDYFENIKFFFSDQTSLMKATLPIISSKWKIYAVNKNLFPLSDMPILLKRSHLFFPLAPDILLEIKLDDQESDSNRVCEIDYSISFFKYIIFLNRTILMSKREIVATDKALLVKLRSYKIFLKRLQILFSNSQIKKNTT